jgi:hypothetical protein
MDMPGIDAPEDAETTVEASPGADSFADSGGSDAGYNGDEDSGSAQELEPETEQVTRLVTGCVEPKSLVLSLNLLRFRRREQRLSSVSEPR